MKYKNNKKYRILGQSVIFSIIFFSIVFSINAASAGGGPDCKSCMNDGGYALKHVNFSAANNSGHKNLNSGASSTVNAEDKKCWACHGDGTQPVSGHPANFKTPAPCENCHIGPGGYGAPLATGHIEKVKIAGVACNTCHGNSGMYTVSGGISSINAVISSDKTYYWTPSSGAIGSSGYNANWGSCGLYPTSYKITSLSSSGFGCNSDNLTTTKNGDQFLAISPTAYSSNTTIAGKTGATVYLSSQKSGYTATYRFDLGYARGGTFTSLGYVTTSVSSTNGQSYTGNLSSISGTAPAGSYLALKVSITTSKGGRISLGTNGGQNNSNSGRFYVTETVTAPSTPMYNVTIKASPASAVITQGGNYTYNITVNNTGNTNGDYTLAVSDSDSTNFITPSVLGRTSIYVPARGRNTTTLKVTANSAAAGGASDIPTVIAVSVQNSSYTNFTQVQTAVTSTPTYNVSISASPTSAGITKGSSYTYSITVNNTGNATGNYTLGVTDSDAVNFNSSTLGITAMKINSGGSAMTTLNVTAKASATTGAIDNTTVTVISVENPAFTNSAKVQTTVISGGPDCKACHDAGGAAPTLVNFSIANISAHKNLNSGASSTVNAENKKCWACHGDGTQPVNGHPANFKTPSPCENCHTGTGGYSAPLVTKHIQNGTDVMTAGVACNICHFNSGMFADSGGIGTTTHYLNKVTDITTTPYGHSGTIDTTNCLICHNGLYTGNASWGSPVNITTSLKRKHTETTNAQCDSCHKDDNVSTLANVDFHNSSVKSFGGPNCLSCHAGER